MTSSISRRTQQALLCLDSGDMEGCLINLFPAIDKTGKRRRPKAGVGERIRKFFADEEGLISGIATGNVFTDVEVNGMSFPQAMYKYGRTSVVHEGELDPRLRFNSDGSVKIGDVWDLNSGYVFGMIAAVIVAPENRAERIESDFEIRMFEGHKFLVNDLWGQRDAVRRIMCELWNSDSLFDDAERSA